MRLAHIGAAEIGIARVRTLEPRRQQPLVGDQQRPQIGVAQIGIGQFRVLQIDAAQIGAGEPRAAQIGAFEHARPAGGRPRG